MPRLPREVLIHQRRDELDPLHLAAPHLLPQEVAHPHQDRGPQIRYHVSELGKNSMRNLF